MAQDGRERRPETSRSAAMILPDFMPLNPVVSVAPRRLSATRVEPVARTRRPHGWYAAEADSGHRLGRPRSASLPPHRGQLVDIFV